MELVTVVVVATLTISVVMGMCTISVASFRWDLFSFCSGVAITLILVCVPTLFKAVRPSVASQERDSRIYGLEHGVLNLQTVSTTWWMNMGYWKGQNPPSNLPQACHALLWKVLDQGGLLDLSGLTILDVGFGCGDQTDAIKDLCKVDSYIGITLDKQQYGFAKTRLLEESSKRGGKNVLLFQADAARPDTWPADLQQNIDQLFRLELPGTEPATSKKFLLALDTLYHFTPSRRPLLNYSCQQLGCSLAAFDLLLSDQPLSPMQLLFLRITCLVSSTPFSNFLTINQYRELLLSAGYREADIRIVDISEDVFGPLARFLKLQDRNLKTMGLGIGRFRAAGSLFNWWAKTGIVRGCIVVAEHRT